MQVKSFHRPPLDSVPTVKRVFGLESPKGGQSVLGIDYLLYRSLNVVID
jgi:hypothetical protein